MLKNLIIVYLGSCTSLIFLCFFFVVIVLFVFVLFLFFVFTTVFLAPTLFTSESSLFFVTRERNMFLQRG